ncbi:putative Nucleoporin nup44 [Glarea lozoyensis 74030]|uniref:Putative Nucleoporin nup44 n=1 Tax=Glarea lozoyensis (strain ATCC 74030 / MF5533) TaxID=1104152 RepID=H0EP55_GLAL7|nr:putative Nucleoporin nup44 [Glarea lozoyensis 74030]
MGSSLWQPGSAVKPREKSIPEQIGTVLEKWDTSSPNCAFQHYFYNKVDDNMVPFYKPGPNEDPKAWDEALSNKPGPGFIPVLCVGFAQLGERIKLQQRNLAHYNARLHEINNSLSLMLQTHDTKTSIRAMDARRRHTVLKQRCLALATKVQVLRNRGYALGGDEEDLKSKLQELERGVSDPGLGARGEEIWARMLTVQERAKLLKAELEKSGSDAPDRLDENMTQQAKKVRIRHEVVESSANTIRFWRTIKLSSIISKKK